MSATTSIEWTDRTWNPVTGCTKVSPGCKHCYAEGVANRFWATQYPALLVDTKKSINTLSTSCHEDYLANGLARPRRFTDVMMHEDRLTEPLRWRKPQKVFVNSMSDLFHEDVQDEFIDQVFAVMARAPQHTFQVLTKRPDLMLAYLRHPDVAQRIAEEVERMNWADPDAAEFDARECDLRAWPLSNVWLGVSVEDQQRADERILLLLHTPAAVRFVSAEPLLGPVNLRPFLLRSGVPGHCANIDGEWWHEPGDPRCGQCRAALDWVIVGGESGPGARPCDVAWVRSIVQQCQSAAVPVFVKQLGAHPIWRLGNGQQANSEAGPASSARLFGGMLNSKGGDPAEWPEDLRVREFPII